MGKFKIKNFRSLPVIFFYLTIFQFFGCSSHVNSIPQKEWPTGIQKGDKLAVVINYKSYSQPSKFEKKVCKCIISGFSQLKNDVEIIATEQVRTFSFLDAILADGLNTEEDINLKFSEASIAEQIENKDIRYIILIEDPTIQEFKTEKSSVEWGATYFIPIPVYTKETSKAVIVTMSAKIYDIKHRHISGEIHSVSRGESRVMLMPPLVFGYPSGASVSKVCNEFGEALAEFIIKQEVTD